MITHCTTVNNLIREMAAKLKLGVSYTCNLVSVWQSQNNSTEYPSIDELKSLLTEQERASNEIGLAIPEYTMEKFDPNKPLARTSKDNKIILMELPKDNPLGYFFDYINGGKNNTSDQKKEVFEKLEKEGFKQEELRELITTPIEAYNFLSWHEMSHVQYNDVEVYFKNGDNLTTPDKIAIEARATKDAWLKARVYRHKHPIDEQQQQAIQQEKQKLNTLKQDLGGGEQATAEVQDAIKVAKKGMSFEEALAGQETFFSEEEQAQIKQGLNGKNLQVMSVSRLTDPAFFSKEIVAFLEKNAEKSLNNPTRVTAIEVWSKHDGLPIKDILDACKKYRVAPMVSFSITGLGGTALEGGVMKYQDMLEKVGELIKNGTLNPTTTTIRIDPILPGVTNMDDIRKIVETAKSYGIKKFVTSLVQSYGYTEGTPRDRKVISGINNALAAEGKTYDWDKYYGRDRNGKINFKPRQEVINDIGKVLLELDKDPEITIQTCAFGINGLKVSACLDPMIIERITGVDVLRKDGTYDRDTSRPECMCYGCHGDFFKGQNKKCYSSCAYCYAAHSGDNKLNYYNEDGTLKDNDYTRTERVQSIQQQSIPVSYKGKVNNNMNNNTNVNDVTKVPEIGTEVIDTNKENPRTKLAKDCNSVTRHDRVIMLARMFSKKVDAIVKEKSKEVAREMADELSKSNPSRDEIMRINARAMLFNDGIKGRRAAMEDATIKKIFESMREDIEDMASTSVEDFEEEYGEGTGERMVAEYNKILDNWYALLDEACIYIEKAENVRVTVEEAKEDNKEVQGKTSDSTQDEDTNDAANNDDEDGERVEGNGGWSFKVRFVDPRTSLSKDVKKILNSIVRFNSNGEIDVDDLGNTRYLDSEVAHAALINHLSNMIDADDFCVKDENGNYTLPALQKVAVRYPWVNQVINALKHNPSAISAFYADFRKDFIPYWTQTFDEDEQVWKTVALNSPVALDSVMSEVTQNYEHGDILEEDSLYTKSAKVNPKAASTGLEEVNNALSDIRDYDSEDDTEMVDTIVKNLRRIGFNTNKTVIGNLLNTENGINDVESVLHRIKRIYQESVNLDADAHLISSLNDDYSEIAKIIGLVSELNNVQSFREGDKTYYSYSAPNYIDTLVKTIKNDARRNSYIEKEFGFTEWFRNSDGKWMSEWVNLLLNDEDVRFQFDTKELLSIDGKQYTDWEPWRIKKAFILEYFSLGINKGSNKQYAWYNIPILSDSPVAKFIKFKRYTGKFVEQLLPLFRNVVKQELWRIKLVQDRAAVGASPIGNFDKVGTKFHFFPELNANDNEFLKNITELKKICKKTGDESAMNDYIDRTILSIMNANFEAFLTTNLSDENKNEIANTLIADGTIKNADGLNAALEEYFWNQAYATTQIIELTTTDLAFYEDGTDFQKRYKEVYAAGTKLNTNSPYGRKVERTIYLTDDRITSNSYLDIKKSLDDAVKLGHITASERDNILSKFKEVNVVDAQAYRSISSMRAVLDMMGAWDDNMQKSYARITNGEWKPEDFNIVWQTIKPFIFTQIQKPDGLGGAMKVSHQNKNSEFLLLALHNVIACSLSKSPKLRAINRFMEKHNIDVIQFESAVKVGKQGIVNINYSKDKLNTWAGQNVAAYNEIESAVTSLGKDLSKMSMYEIFKLGNDTLLDQNKLSQEEYNNRFDSIQPDEEEVYKTLEKCALQENGEYNPTVVHELPYSDYSIQQPTPEHLFDVEAVFGSQFRNLILSDIPEDAIIKVNGKDMTKKEVVYLYHSIVVENLLEDYKKVAGKFSSIESLQKALLDSVKGNPKYGRDMLDALQLVEITDPRDSNKTIKVFNIPLDNPNTTTKIQELVTSMFKNAVTKQHIKGGACILVSSYGLSSDLHVLHGEDGSIKGIECYLPAYSKQFYAPFMVTKHTEEGEEYQELDINKMPLELRRLVGYRIPTEDKYSMAPLIVKGFLPQQNGSAIMLPADGTTIAGWDYDVDKLFLMILEFRLVNKYNIKDAWRDFYASHPDISKQVDNAKWEAFRRYYERVLEEQPEIAEEIDVEDKDFRDWFIKESGLKTYDLVDNIKDEFAKWFDTNKSNYITGTEVAKINYNTNKLPQEQSRQARNNMLIDISYGILTHKDTAEKIHNPGNFDKIKIAARIANIISSTDLMHQFALANNIPIYRMSDEEEREAVCDLILKISSEGNLGVLDKFMKDHSIVRSQLTVDTFIYYHKQNMTGDKLIGIYANNTTMQAKYQASNLAIKENYTFTINGRVISSLHDITAANGERISKNCANFSAASVDNVKDPVLADLMQNTNTASITGFMLRAGMSIEEIGLLFSQPAVRDMVKSDGTLDGIDDVIEKMMNELRNYGGSVDGNIRMHDFTSKELLMNCLNDSLIHNVNGVTVDNEKAGEILSKQIEALLLMRCIMYIAEELNNLTSISRADSPNGAISISIAGSKLQRRKVEIYNRRSTMDIFPIAGVSDASRNNYVSVGMDIDTMREKLLNRRMPMLQTFYSLGIDLSGQILSKYFSQTSAYSDELVDTLCDNADGGIVKEKVLNNMYSELVEFALSKTKLFGDDDTYTFEEKRNYYLNEFYKTYIRVLAENPDIASLNIFKKMTVDENNTIVMLKSGRITPSMKESLMRDFDTLLDSDNPAAQKLAIDLFMYAYYKEGFKFGPNSFGNFFSSNFISSFPEFINTLRTMKYDMQKGSYFDRFLPQFYANHLNESGLVPGIKGKKKGDITQANGMVSVKASLVLNKNIAPLGVYRSYPYIRIGRSIFALQQEGKDKVIYVPALVFGGEQKRGRVIYNANKKVEEMSSMPAINSAEEEASLNKIDAPLTGLENSNPYSTEEGQGELKEPLC